MAQREQLKGFKPADKELWCGRKEIEPLQYFHEIIEVEPLSKRQKPLIAGFCCDSGVVRNKGRQGAAEGPYAFRKALASLPLPEGFENRVIDGGDIVATGLELEEAQESFCNLLKSYLQQGHFVVAIGGGHETAWPHYQALAEHYGSKNGHQNSLKIGVVNFDAHWDLRPLLPGHLGSSGTPFRQIAELLAKKKEPFQYLCLGLQPLSNSPSLHRYAEEIGAKAITAERLHQSNLYQLIEEIDHFLLEVDLFYLSLDLDCFAAAAAPGVSAPQPLGLPPLALLPFWRYLACHPKMIGACIVELNPLYDQQGTTAKLAALMAAELLAAVARPITLH